MIDLSFKVRETTKCGRQLKTLLSQDALDKPIPLSNTCLTCSKDVDDLKQKIECSICSQKYHVPCLTVSLPSDTLDAISTNPCLWWFCGICISKSRKTENLAQESATNSQVDLINSISAQFTEQLSTMRTELMSSFETIIEDKMSSVTEKTSDNAPLYTSFFSPSSEVIKDVSTPSQSSRSRQSSQVSLQSQGSQVPISPSPEVLVLSPKNLPSATSGAMHKVKKFAETSLKTSPTEYIRCYEDTKKVSIGFSNANLRDKAATLINSGDVLDSYGYQSKNSKKMLPKITIDGVSSEILAELDLTEASGDSNKIRELEKRQIILRISDKNPQIKQLSDMGHTLDVIYLKNFKRTRGEHDHEELTIGLKVSPLIHQTIFSGMNGSLYLGNRRYQVKNRFYIKQCYHCQLLGHTSADCPDVKENKFPVCFRCAGRHRSAECTNRDTHRCARCKASPNQNDVDCAAHHNAASLECPVQLREISRMASNTDYTSKNVM